MNAADAYAARGVSATKDDVKKAVSGQSGGLFPGSFCKIVEDLAGDPDWCTAVHADGAGTKSSVAYLMVRETGDRSWYEGIAQDALVMNTDDLACIGATTGFLVSNTIGRNAHRVDGPSIAAVISGYDAMIERLREEGIDIRMTGGETADVGDLVQTMICDSTVVVRMRRRDVVSAANIRPGHVLVGLASFGKSRMERRENSGIGSNGMTAARHLLLNHEYLEKYPETVSATLSPNLAYCGRYRLSDPLPGSGLTVGEALLSPTRTYLPLVRDLLSALRGSVSGLLHCTGGGQAKCRDFGSGLVYVKDRLFDPPPLFRTILESGAIEPREMYQVFNMGHRMEIACEPAAADRAVAIAASHGIEARIIGHVESGTGIPGNRVVIRSGSEEYIY